MTGFCTTLKMNGVKVNPPYELVCLSVNPRLDELNLGAPAVRAVGRVDVVVDPTVLGEGLRLEQ
jgi:hypothetical protein